MRPLVAIVGRPNVGKSSLFNRLVGEPIAIVDPTPGTTRDRILHEVRRNGLRFDLVDTGGIGIVDAAKLETDVYQQVQRAINAADRIVFLVDVREGVCHLDREVAAQLRTVKERVLLAVNKVDHEGLDHDVHQFASLGLGTPLAVSAAQAYGLQDLMDAIGEALPAAKDDGSARSDAGSIRIALCGRRNVGKSSLTNALCGEQRVIVADMPGTTRDAVDVPIASDHGKFVLVDTAGLRKRNDIEEDIEFYAACRSERAIRSADVCLLVLDASDEVAAVDKKIAQYCELEGKPTILVLNKWDIAERAHASQKAYLTWLHDRLPGLRYAPTVFTCALTGAHVQDLLKTAAELALEAASRASTSEVNDLLEAAMQRRKPRKVGGSLTRIYYGTQAESSPPTFIFFVSRTDGIDANWTRYLEGFLRERLACRRVPVRLLFKLRDSKFRPRDDQAYVTDGKNAAEHNHHLVLPRRRSYRDKNRGRDDGQPEAGEA